MTATRAASPSPISPALFAFLRELKGNNRKDWFEANRGRYEEDVLEPCKAFVLAIRARLREISPHFLVEPRVQGGSLFRIHANLRFRPDAPPYKTHSGIQFRHTAGRDVHAPGFYLHLEPEGEPTRATAPAGGPFVGMGSWHPERDALRQIREAIVEDPEGWMDTAHDPDFRRILTLSGESLKRGPKGFDPEHPLIDDIKRKDFIAVTPLTEADVTADGFVERFGELCGIGAPFMAWLCEAVGAPF